MVLPCNSLTDLELTEIQLLLPLVVGLKSCALWATLLIEIFMSNYTIELAPRSDVQDPSAQTQDH